MKKLLILLLATAIACVMLIGCADNKTRQPSAGTDSEYSKPEKPAESEHPYAKEISEMYITVNGNKLKVTLEKNSSADALVEILKRGDITFTAEENGNFEMYGDIGHSLPTNNSHITAQSGDVILYAGRYLCLFFESNSYSYTKIGKINGYSSFELRTLLGAEQGSAQITLSLV